MYMPYSHTCMAETSYVSSKTDFLLSGMWHALLCLHLLWSADQALCRDSDTSDEHFWQACNITVTLQSSQTQPGSHRWTEDFPLLPSTLHLLHMRNKHLHCLAILCVVCAFQQPQSLLLTHFMVLGGVPERLTSSCLSENSYRRETYVVIFYLQVRF
jgi:hypothetical protein